MNLNELTYRIQDEYEQAQRCATDAVQHAVQIGMLLQQAKSDSKHGLWATWIEENFAFGVRQAQKYMRLAEYADQVLTNANPSSLLSINGALKLIADAQYQGRRTEHGTVEVIAPAANMDDNHAEVEKVMPDISVATAIAPNNFHPNTSVAGSITIGMDQHMGSGGDTDEEPQPESEVESLPFDLAGHLHRGAHLLRQWLDEAPVEHHGTLRRQLAEMAERL